MSGFLHSMDSTRPTDDLIVPLRPALWRIGWYGNSRDRLMRLKIPTILVLSDTFPGAYKLPLKDYAAWEAHVRTVARGSKAYNFVWDIWNEPDNAHFWKGTEGEFFETFARAAKVLREELGPNAIISGPSLTRYNLPYITRFLNYCKAQRITLDVLSWHELGESAEIRSITEHLLDARRRFVEGPGYRDLRIKKIHINEIVGRSSTHMPGEILAYLRALELGGADGACKACWGSCWNNTLDGIITPDTQQPCAGWWAYKCYADSVPNRVASSSSDLRVVSFASTGAGQAGSAQVVVGYFADGNSPPTADVRLRLQNHKSRRVRVKIERIPNSGGKPLSQLPVISEETVNVDRSVVETTLGGVRLHEAYLVTITPAAPAGLVKAQVPGSSKADAESDRGKPHDDYHAIAGGKWVPIIEELAALSPDTTRLVDGVLETNRGLILPSIRAKDVIVRARVKTDATVNACLILRAEGKKNYVAFTRATGEAAIGKNDSGFTFLETRHVRPKDFDECVFSAVGETLTLYLNGRRICQVTDSSFRNAGSVGVAAIYGTAWFKDVEVQVLDPHADDQSQGR